MIENEMSSNVLTKEGFVSERDLMENLSGLFYCLGLVTRGKSIQVGGKDVSFPIALRRERAERYKELKNIRESGNYHNKEGKVETEDYLRYLKLLSESRERREIFEGFVKNQGDMIVDLKELGKQKIRYVDLTPPKSCEREEFKDKPPIVFLSTINSDLGALAFLIQELAYQGKRVIVLGYPGSALGEVSEEFVRASCKEKDYGTYVALYKEILKQIYKKNGKLQLYGISTGGAIGAQLMNDPEMEKIVSDAVFLAPASSIDQSRLDLNLGLVYETIAIGRRNLATLPKASLLWGRFEPENKDQTNLKNKLNEALLAKVRTRMDFIRTARVGIGGKIVVWSGEKDNVTKSRFAENSFRRNPLVTVISDNNGSHGVLGGKELRRVLGPIFDIFGDKLRD